MCIYLCINFNISGAIISILWLPIYKTIWQEGDSEGCLNTMLFLICSCLYMLSHFLLWISLLLPANNYPLGHSASYCNKWQRNWMHRGISRKPMPADCISRWCYYYFFIFWMLQFSDLLRSASLWLLKKGLLLTQL